MVSDKCQVGIYLVQVETIIIIMASYFIVS